MSEIAVVHVAVSEEHDEEYDVSVAGSVDGSVAEPTIRGYTPSWFDRLKVWVDQWPGPAWMFYLGGALLVYGLRTILQWVDGTQPVGNLDTSLIFTSVWPWYGLAAMHYLDLAAGRALDGLRPILSGTEETHRELRYRLTTMPARGALAASLGTVALGALIFLVTSLDTSLVQHLEQHIASIYGLGTSPFVLWITLIMVLIVAGLFFYHTARQLLLVRTITTLHTDVAMFQLTPLYKLSRVTAATAAAWSGGITVGALTILSLSQVLSDPVAVLIELGVILLALVTFVWPLLGIHEVLEAGKSRLHLDSRERVREALLELKRRQDKGDYEGVGAMNDALDALLKHQAVVDKISTWPWRSGTVGALATAICLPLVIWTLTHLLAQLIP